MPSSAIQAIGLRAEYLGPSYQGHSRDRIYTSEIIYKKYMALATTIKTGQSAVIAFSESVKKESCTKERII